MDNPQIYLVYPVVGRRLIRWTI